MIDPVLRPGGVFDFGEGLLSERLEGPRERFGVFGGGGIRQEETGQRENAGSKPDRYGRQYHESPLCGKAIRRPTDAVAAGDT